MTTRLRVVLTPPSSGPENMATDLALLRSVGAGRSAPTLRLYGWSGGWVSLGYAQEASAAVNLDVVRDEGLGLVRRPTGGKALLHGRDLTYSLTLPGSHPICQQSVVESYVSISKVLLDALSLVGIRGTVERRESGRGPAVRSCFEEHRVETIRVDGRKLIGSAQARRSGGLLQHGSIPLVHDFALLARLFCPIGQDVAGFDGLHRARITSLAEAAPSVKPEELAAALVAAFGRAFGPAQAGDLTPAESEDSRGLAAELTACG